MKILLAVSGGIDSMYLANRASELYPGARFAVAHCNFSLRGEESDGDQAFVEEWCRTHGVECFAKRFDTVAYSTEHHISIEMAARELRYAWFSELCDREGFDALATAHNANDNAETLILNLLRGTGSKGLRGMSAARAFGPEGRKEILRPLLGLCRKEIEGWMKSHGCEWREDSTNSGSLYKRNLIRNDVFPLFEQLNPSFVNTLNADMKRFCQLDDIAEEYFREASVKVCNEKGINVDSLLECSHWQYVLYRLLERYGFSQETFDKLVTLLTRYKECPRGTVTLGGKDFEAPQFILRARRGYLSVSERRV